MTELPPINPDVLLRGVYLRWQRDSGPLPAALQSADGASTSTIELPTGDLLLKRGYLGPEGLAALIEAVVAGKITAANVLTPQQASALVGELLKKDNR